MLSFGYVARRILFAVVTIFVSVTLNFLLFRFLKGGPVANFARVPHASPALQEELTRKFGLDKPLLQQYLIYVRNLFRGDLGVSFTYQQPVAGILLHALLNTLYLVVIGTFLSIALGTAAGIVAAWRRRTAVDQISSGFAILTYALPSQWLGLVLLIIFAAVLPAGGISNPFEIGHVPFWEHLSDISQHLVLPTLTLVLTGYGSYMIVVRSSMLETMGEDYILTARAKGLPPRRIVLRHAARNAMLPMVTQVALDIGYIVGGAILVEVLFSWPGIGQAVFRSIGQRDYPMLQGGFLLLTVAVVLMNLLADLLYYRLDPRVTR